MARAFNFSAGPSALPEEVLKEAAAEMLDYKGCGMSVMEMSHRSSTFQSILDDAEQTLRARSIRLGCSRQSYRLRWPPRLP